MVTISCLFIGSFLILHTHGTTIRLPEGCNGDPNAVPGCDTCGTNCDNYDLWPRVCSDRTCFKDEWTCKDGFVLNSEGWCIPHEKCPPLCGTNEVYSACGGKCQITCSKKNPVCSKICRPGCICEPDYVRDDDTGECIKEDQCPGCNGDPNAIPGCNTCGTICDNSPKSRVCSYRTCLKNECRCRDGFIKNSKGLCIPYKKCQKSICKENEVFACHPSCPPKTCMARFEMIVCLTDSPCREQCDCKDNYLRNSDGICIPSDQC